MAGMLLEEPSSGAGLGDEGQAARKEVHPDYVPSIFDHKSASTKASTGGLKQVKPSHCEVKTGHHGLRRKEEENKKTRRPASQPQESPNRRENIINGAVTMETMDVVKEAKWDKEETRWEQMYPQLKKCVIVVSRQRSKRPEVLKVAAEKDDASKKDEDPETKFDWMEPLELDVGKRRRGRPRNVSCKSFKTFVKKVEVSVPENHANANSARRVQGRCWRPPVLRLRHFPNPDGTADSDGPSPTDSSFGHLGRNRRVFRHRKYNNGVGENNGKEKTSSDLKISNGVTQSETDHNYSIAGNTPDELAVEGHQPCSQSQAVSLSSCCEQEVGDSHSCCSAETMKPANIVFRKVRGDKWVLRRSDMKKEEEEEEEGEEEDESSVNTEQEVKRRRSARRKWRTDSDDDDEWTPRMTKREEEEPRKNTSPKVQHKRRRAACGQCASCLRKDCGKCVYCLDKSKFGGRNTLKQRCRYRICHVMRMMKGRTDPGQSSDRMERRSDFWTEQMLEKEDEDHNKMMDTHPAQASLTPEEVNSRRWGWRTDDGESEDDDWTPQLEVALDGSQLIHSFLSDASLQNSLSGMVPQEGSVLYIPPPSPSLHSLLLQPKEECEAMQIEAYGRHGEVGGVHLDGWVRQEAAGQGDEEVVAVKIAYGPLGVDGGFSEDGGMMEGSLGGIEEEVVAVEIDAYGRMWEEGYIMEEMVGGMDEEEVSGEGVMEDGQHYDVEVDVPEFSSDEETVTAQSSDVSEDSNKIRTVTEDVAVHDEMAVHDEVAVHDNVAVHDEVAVHDDVAVCDVANEPPQSISLNPLQDRGRSDELSEWRPLLRLLRALRRTVLPPHWVAVLADGPLLQLLQCSKLSSMIDTIVHIRPNYCFHITVQDQPLPSGHTLYHAHPQSVTQLSQLVSLLLELEDMAVCRGSWLRSLTRQLEVRPPTCHLLVRPDRLTCLPCQLGGEEQDIKREEEGEEVRENVASASPSPSLLL